MTKLSSSIIIRLLVVQTLLGVCINLRSNTIASVELHQNPPDTLLQHPTRNETTQKLESFAAAATTTATTKTAIVMRAVDPMHECILQRILAISKLLTHAKFSSYKFFILLDQTNTAKRTTTKTLQRYINKHITTTNKQNTSSSSNSPMLKAPEIFGVSEDRIRSEFPNFAKGYMTEKLADGSFAKVPNRPWLWQLLVPTIAMFSHHHPEFAYTWVFEDDIWSIGSRPLMESFRLWDEAMDSNAATKTDLATFRTKRNGIPYNMEMQQKNTKGFENILTLMKTSIKHKSQWKRMLSKDNQQRSSHWTTWNDTTVPNWACVSDSFYRHSHSFSEYLYAAIAKNIFQFAECFQQPLAWWGDFKVTDLQSLLNETERASYGWEQGIINKVTRAEAIRRFESREDISTLLYHGISSHKMNWNGQAKGLQLGLVWNKLESDCADNPFQAR